jgi:hypothetical protein
MVKTLARAPAPHFHDRTQGPSTPNRAIRKRDREKARRSVARNDRICRETGRSPVRAKSSLFAADGETFLDFGDDLAGGVFHFDSKSWFDLFGSFELLADSSDLFFGDFEVGVDGAAAGTAKADAGGLVPDNVAGAEDVDEHHHKERIGHGVERSAIVRPNVVAISEAQLHFDVDGAPVGIKSRNSDARSKKRGPEIEEPAKVGLGGSHRARVYRGDGG